jgi:hypothetical protein
MSSINIGLGLTYTFVGHVMAMATRPTEAGNLIFPIRICYYPQIKYSCQLCIITPVLVEPE